MSHKSLHKSKKDYFKKEKRSLLYNKHQIQAKYSRKINQSLQKLNDLSFQGGLFSDYKIYDLVT